MTKSDLTLNEVCQELGKSRRTVSKYIKDGLLKPEKITSSKGTIKYKFDPSEIKKLKLSGKVEGKGKKRREVSHHSPELVTLLKEQIKVKDNQIKDLQDKIDKFLYIQKDMNNRIMDLSDKILMIEGKTTRGEYGEEKGSFPSSKLRQFIDRLFGRK